MMLRTINNLLISMLFVLCVTPMLCAENVPGLNVSYDQKEDLLTVDANFVPLTHVFAQIATQSGIEIIVDPSIEKDISIYLPPQPLENALKQLARDLNYAMQYDNAGSRLVAMKIVPQGKQDSGNFVSSATKPNIRSGRLDGLGDGNNETIGGGSRDIDYNGGRNYSAGNPSELRGEPKLPDDDQQRTVDPVELEARGINAHPRKHKKALPVQQNERNINDTQPDLDNTNK